MRRLGSAKREEDLWKQQMPCRYGRGCTHIADDAHCARYWHPAVPLAAKSLGKCTDFVSCKKSTEHSQLLRHTQQTPP